jgi:hypothetical protein
MAKRRSEGLSLAAVASEFQTTVERVSRAINRAEDYERGVALLRDDAASIEGLHLVGMLRPLVRRTLADNRITRLTDLEGRSPDELLRMPHIGGKVVDQLFALLDECRGAISNQELA